MIILPDRNIPRARFLVPVKKTDWQFSLTLPKDQLGNDGIRIRFRVRAKTNDGRVMWCGWFEDREDFDAFLFAITCGSLHYEPALWRLPTPEWHPGISDGLVYDFLTQTILTTTGSNQTYTSPVDWDNSSNQIECLGGGGSGAAIRSTSAGHATGGGGGAYSAITNFSFASPGVTTATYRVGSGAAGANPSSGGAASGTNGGATWWNNTTDPGNGTDNTKCSADWGGAGQVGAGSRNGGSGGSSSSSWGQVKYSGGSGGNLTGASGVGGSGGGGAAGPAGNGGNGVNSSSTSTVGTNGGSANNGTTSGGAGSTGLNASGGGSGTEFSGSYGCGSGGGGWGNVSVGGFGNSAGDGGSYGGGGGGAAKSVNGDDSNGGDSIQGLIIVEYEPRSPIFGGNMPMLGM